MIIYLVRHGIAEDHPSEGKGDSARKLTDEGREKTIKVAHAFRKRAASVDVIFHSPYRRAKETAEIFAEEFSDAKLAESPLLIPRGHVEDALVLAENFRSGGQIMMVGHEPHLSMLASLLLTGHSAPILEFKKAGIAAIECLGPPPLSRLLFLLTPKFLA